MKTPNLTDEQKAAIDKVISGETKEYETTLIVPDMIEGYMDSKGWEKADLETNGWEYDWWLTFTKAGKSFTAGGSGYYGTFEFAPTDA